MMDPSNRVDPAEVLPDASKLHAELEALQAEVKERAMRRPLPESKGVKGHHVERVEMDEAQDFQPSRAERRQQVLDQRAQQTQRASRARMATRRGVSLAQRRATTGRGRR